MAERSTGTTILKGKLHSQIINSDAVGFFRLEFDGGSQRSKFEQKHGQTDGPKIAKKFPDDDDAASITSLAPGVKNSRLQNGLEFDRAQFMKRPKSHFVKNAVLALHSCVKSWKKSYRIGLQRRRWLLF